MTLNTITRHTALAVPITLPLLPVSAYAGADDPAIEAYEEWRKACGTFLAALKTQYDDDPVLNAADHAERAAATKFAETVPTTLAGLAAQISFTPYWTCHGFGPGEKRSRKRRISRHDG
jgi:hypothetical protein